jgi:hypothetical protein
MEAELTEHLRYEKHDQGAKPVAKGRNGTSGEREPKVRRGIKPDFANNPFIVTVYCALLSTQKMKIVKVDSGKHNWLCRQRPGLCLPVLEG